MPSGVTGVDSPVDGGGGRFDFGAVRRALKGAGREKRLVEEEEEVSERRDRWNRCGHFGKLCALLLMRCFRNPRNPRRIDDPILRRSFT